MSIYMIVCPLVFLAGLIDAIAGGGGLISLPAYMIAGLPVHLAIGTNKLSGSMGTIAATYRYGKGGFIAYRRALAAAVFGLAGSFVGARLTLLLSDAVFRYVMLAVVPVTAFYVLRMKKPSEAASEQSVRVWLVWGIAFALGVYDGFYGPGTGTFLLLLLTTIGGVGFREAQGTTKVVNLATNLMALAVFLYHGKVDLLLGLVAGVFSILGNYIGAAFFANKGFRVARPVIVVVLVLFFAKTLSEIWG